MKYNHERLMRAKRDSAMVSACSISIDQALHAAVASIGGTAFDAKLKEVEQQLVWRIKLLTSSGRVKVYLDARTGRILEAKAEITIDESQQPLPEESWNSGCPPEQPMFQ